MRLGKDGKVVRATDELAAHAVAVFREELERQGLSQEELGARLGVSGSAVHQVLWSRRNIGLRTLMLYANALGLSVHVEFQPAGTEPKPGWEGPTTSLEGAVRDLTGRAATGDEEAFRNRLEEYLWLALKALRPERATVRVRLPVDDSFADLRCEFESLLDQARHTQQDREATEEFMWRVITTLRPDLGDLVQQVEPGEPEP